MLSCSPKDEVVLVALWSLLVYAPLCSWVLHHLPLGTSPSLLDLVWGASFCKCLSLCGDAILTAPSKRYEYRGSGHSAPAQFKVTRSGPRAAGSMTWAIWILREGRWCTSARALLGEHQFFIPLKKPLVLHPLTSLCHFVPIRRPPPSMLTIVDLLRFLAMWQELYWGLASTLTRPFCGVC